MARPRLATQQGDGAGVLFLDLPAGRSSSGVADAASSQRLAGDSSVRAAPGRAGDCARGCRAGAPKVMAEEAKAAADTPPPPPDKEDGEARCRNRVDLHAIEQTQLRRRRRVDGVGA